MAPEYFQWAEPEDFNLYSNTGKGLDWPIKYEDLEKYYCLAEAYLGVSGDSKSTNPPRSKDYPFPEFPYTNQDRNLALAFEKLNISHENLPIARRNVAQSESRHAPCQTTGTCKYCPFGAKYVATDYLNDMVNYGNHPNLKIHTGLYAEKILMSSKNRAIGIRTKSRVDGQSVDIYAHTIIVSSGAIEAAKLLQRSTSSEWASGIGNDNGLVGKFLISHPFFSFSAILNENKDALLPEMDFPTLCSRHFDSPEEQSMMKFILLNPPNIHLASLMKEGLPTKEIQQKIKGKCRIKLDGMLESFPYEYNQIENLNIKNRFGMFQTKVTYTSDPKFDFRVNQIQGEVEKIFKAMGAQSTGEFTVSLRADHASSLTRMSNSCESGVVDENLKVHGVDNLFVCSNSVFPSGGSVNPTLTLVALSIRLSEHLCK